MTSDQYRALQRDPVVVPTPERLFDFVVETLVARGLAQYADADPFRRNLPSGLFLLVPPRPAGRRLAELISLVAAGSLRGCSYLDESALRDVVDTPSAPYLLIDLDDGLYTCDPETQNSGRSPLTVWEGIVHAAIFPMMFETHELVLAGTEHSSGAIPTLCVHAGQPELRAFWYGYSGYPRRGIATCGLRAGAPEGAAAPAAQAALSPA